MPTEVRAKNDFRPLSTDRDLKHCMVPMMKGATQLTEMIFSEEHEKLVELQKMVAALVDGVNKAKSPENQQTAIQLLQTVFTDIYDQVDKEVQYVFMANFMYVAISRYICGVRETTSRDTLQETDIFDISVLSGMCMFIPEKYKKALAETMRDRNYWFGLDDVTAFRRVEVHIPPEDSIKTDWNKQKGKEPEKDES